LGFKFILEKQYAVIHPDDFGQEWNIRFNGHLRRNCNSNV